MNTVISPSRCVELGRVLGHGSWVTCVACSPDGRLALSGSGQPPEGGLTQADYTVRVWDLTTALEPPAPAGHFTLQGPHFTPQDIRESYRFVGHSDQVTAVAFTPDGRRCLSASLDGTVRLWDLEKGQEIHRFVGHSDRVKCLAVSPDGCLALSGGCDRVLRLWDLEKGRAIHQFREQTHWVTSVTFALDGRNAVSGSLDGRIRLWDLVRRREVRGDLGGGLLDRLRASVSPTKASHFAGHKGCVMGVAFDPGGQRILSAGVDRTVRVWEVRTGQEERQWTGHTLGITSLALARDGRRVLTGSLDKTIRLWEVETGEELACLEGHTDVVSGVAFAPDGNTILSGSADRTLRVWRILGLPGQ